MNLRNYICRIGVAVLATSGLPLSFAQHIAGPAKQQIAAVMQMKKTLTAAQQKESSDLIMSGMAARNQLPAALPNALSGTHASAPAMVLVDIKAAISAGLLQQIGGLGGQVVNSSKLDGELRVSLPLLAVDVVATRADVQWIRSADLGVANTGAVTSQGTIAHTAGLAQQSGFMGQGVRVGVLSDSASQARVQALIASGDLPADTMIVPGQRGQGADEGTAMMEIIHDLAPSASLVFATALGGQANFANNIRTLRFTYHCDIIVDDFTYFFEGAFQDDVIARAVNDVTADGALYFSSAANSGNLTFQTSGTWEGDFQNGAALTGGPVFAIEGEGFVHNFGTAQVPQLFNVLTGPGTGGITLKWSDPLAKSDNDYDLFVLDSTGTMVKGASFATQSGTQDPVEFVGVGSGCGTPAATGYCPAAGDQIVVVLFTGEPRALRIDTNRGRLALATAGSTFGHNAGVNTVSMAATAWNSGHNGTKPFSGAINSIEPFSSDGPRKIFYNPDGTPITDGNVLFATGGGMTLQKPDATAADGVFTHTPGFLPFFGTSAAAPHAAAIAALVKSVNPGLSNSQVRSLLLGTTVDNMAPGSDRDSGAGILMALPAVHAAQQVTVP